MTFLKLIDVMDLPKDFRQVLYDLFHPYAVEQEPAIKQVKVYRGNIEDHLQEWEENKAYWDYIDYEIVEQYAHRIAVGIEFPPLVADRPKGLLLDGYHRLGAYQRLNKQHAAFIYLDD